MSFRLDLLLFYHKLIYVVFSCVHVLDYDKITEATKFLF